jgi:hypothetical protein
MLSVVSRLIIAHTSLTVDLYLELRKKKINDLKSKISTKTAGVLPDSL